MRLGADRAFDFRGKISNELYDFRKQRLDQRFVAELADKHFQPLWSVPAKHLKRLRGSEGVLEHKEKL